ncbi:hypothetical protein GN156_34475, partial [bacterium LRH843]|nr:hypothetical protein [bacterium LRH843]
LVLICSCATNSLIGPAKYAQQCNEVHATSEQSLSGGGSFNQRILKAHNKIRAIYSLKKLRWSSSLEEYSRQWANYLRDNRRCS